MPIVRFKDSEPGEREQKIDALKEEFDLLKTFHHSHLVPYRGTIINKETIDIIQDFRSSTLLEHCKNLPIDESHVANYTQDILIGLEFIHYKGMLHSNLKAGNVFVKSNGTCQIADFGRAKQICMSSKSDLIHTSPYWTAPE